MPLQKVFMVHPKGTFMAELVTLNGIENKIYVIRGKKVMLDRDLSDLYEVETSQLKRAVRRNIYRFPEDFLFELTKEEYENLRCQFGTLRWGEHAKYLPCNCRQKSIRRIQGRRGVREGEREEVDGGGGEIFILIAANVAADIGIK